MTAIPHPLHAAGHDESDAHAHEHHELSFFKKYIFSTDHKIIGLQFLFLGLMFFVIGGMEAMLVRWQLGWPDKAVPVLGAYMKATKQWSTESMPPEFYTSAFTIHASIIIFFVIIPLLVGTFGNYLIPLKIGAGDMAFPFLNGIAFWSALPAGTIMVAALFIKGGPPLAGWTSYPPLSALWVSGSAPGGSNWGFMPALFNYLGLFLCFMYICEYYVRLGNRAVNIAVSIVLSALVAIPGNWAVQYIAFDGQSCWFLAIFILGFSSIMGAVNYLATIIKLRCPGMTMFRMPLSVWALFITSILVLLATPVLAGTLMMNLLEHQIVHGTLVGSQAMHLTSFFNPYNWFDQSVGMTATGSNSGGGYAIMHQHLFWFYSHPAVYIMILPAMGMVSDIIATFARKPIFGYRPMVYAMAGIAFLGFIVWAHHMFQSGMNPTLGTTFAVSTMFIAVPSAIKTFNWLGTLWGGNIQFTVPMCNALAFVSMFIIGGLSGI